VDRLLKTDHLTTSCNMNSDLHLFDQLFEEWKDPSFHLAPSLPSLQELFADWLDFFLWSWELPMHAAVHWEELRGLYLLTERISLQYCRSDQLERELRQLGVFDEREVKRLTDGLQVFLKIVRSSELQPIHLCTLKCWNSGGRRFLKRLRGIN
jgi:hypothetical protein